MISAIPEKTLSAYQTHDEIDEKLADLIELFRVYGEGLSTDGRRALSEQIDTLVLRKAALQ